MSIPTTFDAFSNIITYQPEQALIKSGTATTYFSRSTDPNSIYGDIIDAPPVIVIMDQTNLDPNSLTGFIIYTITIGSITTVVKLISFGPTLVFELEPVSTPLNVLVEYIPGPGLRRAIRITIDNVSYNIIIADEVILPTTNFSVGITFNKAIQLITGPAASIGALGGPGAGGGFTPIGQIGPSQPVRVPIIDIYGQTTIDGDYLSDMTFVIQDQYKYKCNDKCKEDTNNGCYGCTIYYLPVNKLKTTTFQENNIPLEDVVRGKGTLQEKVFKLYNLPLSPEFQDFYERFIRYGMLKYILIKLLYGEFDSNKLCRNFNKQFFKDLANSRFCGFIEYFENPANGIMGFDQYYIKCCQK